MLKFDPHEWLTERSESVASVAAVAGVRAKNEHAKRSKTAATVAPTATDHIRNVATVADVAASSARYGKRDPRLAPATVATTATLTGPSEREAEAILRDWHARLLKSWWSALSSLDPCGPRPGFTMGRWQTLYDASVWFLDKHATQAARDGWSTGDVFGIDPRMECGGGLIDRLGECRGLVMDADRASWTSSFYGARCYGRGRGAGLQPFWSVEL